MRTFDDLRLLGDQILVRNLGTSNRQGSIIIPETAVDGRKIHRSGGDYIHKGEVVKVGPGDKLVSFNCKPCRKHFLKLQTAKSFNCPDCGGALERTDYECAFCDERAEMPVSVGDVVLYENRRDAKLQPRRFPSLGLDEDAYVVLLCEQHVLAVIE